MNEETIVAIFDSAEQADAAVHDLLAADVPETTISRHARTASGMTPLPETTTDAEMPREEGFWSRLFGGEREYDHHVYDRSIEGGSTVVSVRVGEAHVTQVSEILDRHNPIDIDERASGYGLAAAPDRETAYDAPMARSAELGEPELGTAGSARPMGGAYQTSGSDVTDTGAVGTGGYGGARVGAEDSETLQLSEERLTVGKRLINRGGTRIRRYVVETPVEEQVTLHDERVVLDRRPVAGNVAVGDAAFTDRTIEMTETTEEAVVSKAAFVTEEVRLRREAVDRVETVRDTVRREEVEVEHVPEETITTPRR